MLLRMTQYGQRASPVTPKIALPSTLSANKNMKSQLQIFCLRMSFGKINVKGFIPNLSE
jgi:hypothetical protein